MLGRNTRLIALAKQLTHVCRAARSSSLDDSSSSLDGSSSSLDGSSCFSFCLTRKFISFY